MRCAGIGTWAGGAASRWPARGPHQFHLDCALLALRTHFHLEAHALVHLRPLLEQAAERLDVHEDLLPAFRGLDEAEAAVVVPGVDGAFEAHGRGFLEDSAVR